ncbi:hypothetical protein B0J14DRAFT_26104 [Halenospora varia]|nr:hypothetical protein B0J14DRAFT_26104 [Halenospora varia]
MFGSKRRRAASNPSLNGANASVSATTAAAQAFLKNRASNTSLSSAAAAAALRSRPTTPVSVADVQTKRTLRRAASTSSAGSGGSIRGPPGSQLERRGSGGSMTERTFRDPSPARPSQAVPSAPDAPPVPAIPKNIRPQIPQKSHRRASSLEAPAARVSSPPLNMASGRGSSLGPTGSPQQNRTAGQRPTSLSSVQELTGVERPASRGSVNFSLPTSSRPTSPYANRRLTSPSPQRPRMPTIVSPTNQNLVYDPNTRSFLPQAEILAIEQRLYDSANKPVKKKKRVPQATGTHLSGGTVGGRPRGTAIDAMEARAEQQRQVGEPPAPVPQSIPEPTPVPVPVAEAPKKKKKQKVVVSDSDSDQASYVPNSSDNDSDFAPPSSSFNTRAGALLAKKPSVVREDREREEEEDDFRPKNSASLPKLDTSPATGRTISPTPLPRSAAGRGHGKAQASASAVFAEERQHTRSASQPPLTLPASTFVENGIPPATRDSVRGGRVKSVSPARTTHFATAADNLLVKHQPPPRSISPRKSALKHPSTPRGNSPASDNGISTASRQAGAEGSDDLAVPKRKSYRVSFDENSVVVGQAATTVTTDSPIAPSPQSKRPWYSIGRGKKKEPSPLAEDDDEVMKPRPALPSFGSVRKSKEAPKEVQERPLVRPPPAPEERTLSMPSPPLFSSPTGEEIEYPLGQSNDHVVGAVLSQDAASKNTANMAKSREPLPPQVTSVEGNGYVSDSSSESSVDIKNDAVVTQEPESKLVTLNEPNIENNDKAIHSEEDEQWAGENGKTDEGVPSIVVLEATPTLKQTDARREWPDMPGSWNNSNSDSGSQNQDDVPQQIVEHHTTEPTPAEVGIAEPSPETPQPGLPAVGDIVAENSRSPSRNPIILEESEESDSNSIYSDAAEDLSDLEGDGFMSLDAVVESPVVPTAVPGLALSTLPESPTSKATKEHAYRKAQLQRKSSEPGIDEGWDRAQEYWKGLSADKKRQLELDAKEEAEDEQESETEVEEKPAPKPKKKKAPLKSALKPSPEIRQPVPNNERSYMINPGSKAGPEGHASMRQSMRAEPPAPAGETHMRKSMRSQAAGRSSFRNSVDSSTEHRGALQKKHRPMSLPTNEYRPDPAAVEDLIKKLSVASAQVAPAAAKRELAAPPPKLRRKGSGDSDSSFKRERSRPSNEIPAFRRSMRNSVGESPNGHGQSPMASSRFSLRSLSPTRSTAPRPFSSGSAPSMSTPTHMRSSMRSSSGSVPTLRGPGSSSRAKSPLSFGGFGRSVPKSAKQKAPKRSSRFNDSSDEEDSRPAFRSRFVDSSDDDEPALRASGVQPTLRSSAVRGIPKRAGVDDGDSSDLPDSDDEKPTSPKKPRQNGATSQAPQTNGTAAQTSNQGTALVSGTLKRSGSGRGTMSPTTATSPGLARPNHARRGSFMSILRRKKADPSSKVRKSDAESPARRDTPLERSKSELSVLKAERPSTPRLQKKNPNGTWPLVPPSPPNVLGGEDGRPFTADDGNGIVSGGPANGVERPDLGNRRFTATGLSGIDINVNGTGKPRKKKKFGTLRRMFRLDD